MPSIGIIGAQWGDEGKGKIVDYLAEKAEMVVRYQGGANAGHTVVIGESVIKLHLLPCGVLRGVASILGEGMVVDCDALDQECAETKKLGFDPFVGLRISDRAHLVLPHHKLIDAGGGRIGTTSRGIGPAYTDRAARIGVRMGDLANRATLEKRLATLREVYPKQFAELGWQKGIPDVFQRWQDSYGDYVTDTGILVRQACREGKRVLFEGGQGTMLDVSLGTYPYVTSSHTTAGGIAPGAGIPPSMVGEAYGVAKAYTTRVGDGPFPTELLDETGERLRQVGHEFGATTGRPRRCGWVDGVALRYACEINGFAGLIVTKLDVLSGVKKLRIGREYLHCGKPLGTVPVDVTVMEQVEVVYDEYEGWSENLEGVTRFDDLPASTRRYLEGLAAVCHTPVVAVSAGAERQAIILRRELW